MPCAMGELLEHVFALQNMQLLTVRCDTPQRAENSNIEANDTC